MSRRGRRSARRKRPFLVVVLATLGSLFAIAAVVAVVAATFVGGLVRSYEGKVTTIPDAIPTPSSSAAAVPSGPGDAMNILLIGSDSRVGTGAPDADRVSGSRSDSMMLVHLPADRRSVQVVSIMRDSWVDIPGHGMAKLNAAYAFGGVPLTVETVQDLLGVPVDHVAEIGFAGFAGMTDALGGVDVDSQTAFTQSGFHFVQGRNHLQGDSALAFVRARYPFADADHQRVRNQQAFLDGVSRAVLSKGTLTSPSKVSTFVDETARFLSVDAGLSFARLTQIGWSLRDVRSGDVRFATVPTSGGGVSPDGQSYVSLNAVELGKLTIALRSDSVDTYLDERVGR